MNLIALNIESLRPGQPLPFALRRADGVLLTQKGFVFRNREELATMLGRDLEIFVDTDESGESHRSYMAQLQSMLLAETHLGQIANVKLGLAAKAATPGAGKGADAGPPNWTDLQLSTTQLLRTPSAEDFLPRILGLRDELARHCRQAPDATLLALVYLSALETRMYSATHAMLVACVDMIVAHETLHWPEARCLSLCAAALTMNLSMTALQDALTTQVEAPSAAQMERIHAHAADSEALLRQLGVTDEAWLQAVRQHHDRAPGALAARDESGQMARLIQRADLFGARIAPRATRHPMLVTAAMQASYYDEARQVDEAGAALIKTLGVYPPGSFVRLASEEVGVVMHRGASATTPKVAVVLNRSGMATGEPIPRDTAQPQWKITAALPQRQVRVKTGLQRLLDMV